MLGVHLSTSCDPLEERSPGSPICPEMWTPCSGHLMERRSRSVGRHQGGARTGRHAPPPSTSPVHTEEVSVALYQLNLTRPPGRSRRSSNCSIGAPTAGDSSTTMTAGEPGEAAAKSFRATGLPVRSCTSGSREDAQPPSRPTKQAKVNGRRTAGYSRCAGKTSLLHDRAGGSSADGSTTTRRAKGALVNGPRCSPGRRAVTRCTQREAIGLRLCGFGTAGSAQCSTSTRSPTAPGTSPARWRSRHVHETGDSSLSGRRVESATSTRGFSSPQTALSTTDCPTGYAGRLCFRKSRPRPT
jgi:hypothetical protein